MPRRGDGRAIILVYHRFGNDQLPSTSVRLDQLDQHIQTLKDAGSDFMHFGDYITALRTQTLGSKQVVIVTVDDAYDSFRDEGWPRFKAAGIPVTLFVATGPVDAGSRTVLDWDDIRALQADGVEIGHHGFRHLHLNAASDDEILEDLAISGRRFTAELGAVPDIFAYPYGEFSPRVQRLVQAAGFKGAAAQYSGVSGAYDDVFAIPRFAINTRYGSADRFAFLMGLNYVPYARMLGTKVLLGADDDNPPALGFRLVQPPKTHPAFSCFASHSSMPPGVERIGDSYSVTVTSPFPKGRSRVNCTARGRVGWYWIGFPVFVPTGLPPTEGGR